MENINTPMGPNPDYNPEAGIARLREQRSIYRAALEPFARMFRWTNLPANDDDAQVFWRKHWLTGERMKLTTEHFRLAALAFYHNGVLPTIPHGEEQLAEAMAEEMLRWNRMKAMQAALDEFESSEL